MGDFAASRPSTIVLPFVFRPKHFINQTSANSALINIACIIRITYNCRALQRIGSGTHKKAKYGLRVSIQSFEGNRLLDIVIARSGARKQSPERQDEIASLRSQ